MSDPTTSTQRAPGLLTMYAGLEQPPADHTTRACERISYLRVDR